MHPSIEVKDDHKGKEVIDVLMLHESLVGSAWCLAEEKIMEGADEIQVRVDWENTCDVHFAKVLHKDQVPGFFHKDEIIYILSGCVNGVIRLKMEKSEIANAVFYPWRDGGMVMKTNIILVDNGIRAF